MTHVATTIEEASQWLGDRRTVCCAGVFDGVHRGHQELIGAAVEEAKRRRMRSLVFTFRNHPLTVLAPAYAPPMLTEPDEKRRRLAALRPSVIVLLEFDREFAALEPEAFVLDILARRLHVISIWCGIDFRFGRDGRGDPALLEAMRARSGIAPHTIEPVRIEGLTVSSSCIRTLIEEGDVERAAALLGRRHLVAGLVVSGFGRGRALGFPTANLAPPSNIVLPADGIYAVVAETGGGRFGGMLNLGPSPTFGVADRRFEVHLLDFEGDLVGRALTVHFVARLREIRKFETAAKLVAQIRADERRTRKILKGSIDGA